VHQRNCQPLRREDDTWERRCLASVRSDTSLAGSATSLSDALLLLKPSVAPTVHAATTGHEASPRFLPEKFSDSFEGAAADCCFVGSFLSCDGVDPMLLEATVNTVAMSPQYVLVSREWVPLADSSGCKMPSAEEVVSVEEVPTQSLKLASGPDHDGLAVDITEAVHAIALGSGPGPQT
jgi:hypothetical protein